MDVLTCEQARRHLPAFHDGELPLAVQIAVQAHLGWCRTCAEEAQALARLGETLRALAAARLATTPDVEPLAPALLGRIKAERALSFRAHVEQLFEDLHLVWAGLTAVAATVASVVVLWGLVSLATSHRPDSLKALLTALATPGSDANPVRPDERVQLPRVDPEAVMPAVLLSPAPPRDEALLALAAVVTREGRIADLEILVSNEADRRWLLEVLAAAAAARFEPAQVGGSPVAVNLVWLLTHTRVRGRTHG
jgi:hypothetical protein